MYSLLVYIEIHYNIRWLHWYRVYHYSSSGWTSSVIISPWFLS